MTAIEWIEKAQEVIKSAIVSDHRFNNIGKIGDAIKYLNEAKELIQEHKPCSSFNSSLKHGGAQ